MAILATLREVLFLARDQRSDTMRTKLVLAEHQGEFHAKTPSRKEVLSVSLASLREKPARLVGLRQSCASRGGSPFPRRFAIDCTIVTQ